jgi:calcium/proton exchanger cax
MLGSIFSNLLLVLGCCFFFGGIYYKEQEFNATSAISNLSLLTLSSLALVLPTPFAEYYEIDNEEVREGGGRGKRGRDALLIPMMEIYPMRTFILYATLQHGDWAQ